MASASLVDSATGFWIIARVNRVISTTTGKAIITDQLDPSAAANIQAAGGAKLVFETVRQLLVSTLKLGEDRTDESA